MERDECIRLMAYELWEQAGRPEGPGTEFWLEAERMMDAWEARQVETRGCMPSARRPERVRVAA